MPTFVAFNSCSVCLGRKSSQSVGCVRQSNAEACRPYLQSGPNHFALHDMSVCVCMVCVIQAVLSRCIVKINVY